MFNTFEEVTQEQENLDFILASAQEEESDVVTIEDLFPEYSHIGAPTLVQLGKKKRNDDEEADFDEELETDPEVQILQEFFAQAV